MQITNKEINRLAFPAIISGIAEPVISLVDTYFVGKLGTEALAGVGIATSFFLFIIWTLAQSKTAVSAIVSRYFGEGKLDDLKSFIPQAILIIFVSGFFVFALTASLAEGIFGFYNAKDLVLQNAVDYYVIRAMGIPIVLCTFACFGVFRGSQNTSWAMQISIVGLICNTVLDYLLISGVEGLIPSMGVKGAALASLISQMVMFFLALIFLHRKTRFRLFYFNGKAHPEIGSLFVLGFTLFIRTVALNIAFWLAARFATSYSDEHMAAHAIGLNIWLFASYFIDGFANAGNAISGRLQGAGKNELIFPLAKKLIIISVGISITLSLLFYLLSPKLASFFGAEEEVIRIFNSFFWMIIISQPINAIAFSLDGVFKGLGKGVLLMINLLIAALLVFVPVLLILDHFQFEMIAIWTAFVAFMFSRGLHLFYFLRKDYHSST